MIENEKSGPTEGSVPTQQDASRKSETPNEFSAFVRRIGIAAFDHVSHRLSSGTAEGEKEGALRKLASQWDGMSPQEKERFFDYVVSGAQTKVTSAPALRSEAHSKPKGQSVGSPQVRVQPRPPGRSMQ